MVELTAEYDELIGRKPTETTQYTRSQFESPSQLHTHQFRINDTSASGDTDHWASLSSFVTSLAQTPFWDEITPGVSSRRIQ